VLNNDAVRWRVARASSEARAFFLTMDQEVEGMVLASLSDTHSSSGSDGAATTAGRHATFGRDGSAGSAPQPRDRQPRVRSDQGSVRGGTITHRRIRGFVERGRIV